MSTTNVKGFRSSRAATATMPARLLERAWRMLAVATVSIEPTPRYPVRSNARQESAPSTVIWRAVVIVAPSPAQPTAVASSDAEWAGLPTPIQARLSVSRECRNSAIRS